MKSTILFFLLNSFFIHDIQVAFFKLSDEKENISIEIKFEREHIKSAFDKTSKELNSQNLKEYLSEHFDLYINNQKKILSFDEIKIKHKHILLQSTIPKANGIIKTVSIKNTCLLTLKNHSNIIELRLNDLKRDFLMNNQRTSINVQY